MSVHFYYGTRRTGPGFVLKHLLGEYSLARSFWLHTVLSGALPPVLTLVPLLQSGAAL